MADRGGQGAAGPSAGVFEALTAFARAHSRDGRSRRRTKEDGADVDAVAREELCDGASEGLRSVVSLVHRVHRGSLYSQTWLRWGRRSGTEGEEAACGWLRSPQVAPALRKLVQHGHDACCWLLNSLS